MQGKLGGGEGTEGVYGSITQMGMQKVLDVLRNSCGLDSRSVFIDIGAGLGRYGNHVPAGGNLLCPCNPLEHVLGQAVLAMPRACHKRMAQCTPA